MSHTIEMKKEGKYKHGLKAPDDYFEGFEERLFTKISEAALPGKSGLTVPEGYFDGLEEQIIQKVVQIKPVKVIPLYKRKAFIYVASVAAAAVLVFSIFTKGTEEEFLLEIADIEAYFEEGGMEYNSYDIAQLLSENDLDDLSAESATFTEESLEEYLLENLDDTTLLIE